MSFIDYKNRECYINTRSKGKASKREITALAHNKIKEDK